MIGKKIKQCLEKVALLIVDDREADIKKVMKHYSQINRKTPKKIQIAKRISSPMYFQGVRGNSINLNTYKKE